MKAPANQQTTIYGIADSASVISIEEEEEQNEAEKEEKEESEVKEDGYQASSPSCRQVCTFISLALALIMDNASYYMKEPFFPVVAKGHNVTEAEIGVIFGSHFLVALLFSPVVGKFLPVFGTRRTFLTGLAIGVVTDVMFIYVKLCESRHAFFFASLSTECVAAIGSAATDTAALAIVAQVFPQNVAKMIGMVETFSGIACLFGQPMGGLLYQFGGYELPFLAFGAITLICLVINFILLPSIEKTSSSPGSLRELIRIRDVYPICLFVFVVAFCDGFLQPILALKAYELDLSAASVGVLFLLQGIVYTIFASMCGWIADSNGSYLNKPMALTGVFIISISFLVMGPSPIFSLTSESMQTPVLAVGLSLMGVGLAMAYVPTYPELIGAAFDNGMVNDLKTQGVAAGLSMALFSLGSFIGPIAGSSAYQLLGFAYSTSLASILCLFFGFIISIFYIWRTFSKT
ncbi:MFS-type transporter SLC18B1-like isoform X2 [Apostichopus japonicus]|uniref:MFS-type transporter SLC18B1-like isoform X2 n=1 Tax=Stichopus japonicus TaxID=307972 RepID=UPI003AB84E82